LKFIQNYLSHKK